MDFTQALAVLQQRSQPSTMQSGADPQQQCFECTDDEQPLTQTLPTGLSSLSTHGLLRLFLDQQEDRVSVYQRFEQGFVNFLQVAEAKGYEALVSRTTATFSNVSAAVNAVEAELRSRGSAMADTLRRVQQCEQQKLQLTARLQIVRHGQVVDELHAESDDAAEASRAERTAALRSEEAAELRAKLAALTDTLNDELDEVRIELSDGEDAHEP